LHYQKIIKQLLKSLKYISTHTILHTCHFIPETIIPSFWTCFRIQTPYRSMGWQTPNPSFRVRPGIGV